MTDVLSETGIPGVAEFAETAEPLPVAELPANPYSNIARTAISQLLERVPPPKQLHIGEVTRVAFDGEKLPKDEFRSFCDAVNNDPRLTYMGNARLAVVGEAAETAAPPQQTTRPTPVEAPTNGHDTAHSGIELEKMLKNWRKEAPKQRRKPQSRRRVHFKKGTAMSGMNLEDYTDSEEQ